MPLAPNLSKLVIRNHLFLGASSTEAQERFTALRRYYGRDRKGHYLLDEFAEGLQGMVDAPDIDWQSESGVQMDEARHFIGQNIAAMAGMTFTPTLSTTLHYVTNYVFDFGRRDLYGERRQQEYDITAFHETHGLNELHGNLLHIGTAQMLDTELEAMIAHDLCFSAVHSAAVRQLKLERSPKNQKEDHIQKISDVLLLSRPLIELTELAFRNRGFALMGGKPKPGIKHYEHRAYDFRVSKLEIIDEPFLSFLNYQNDKRHLRKYPPPQ